jgi:hypothetical protein
MNLAAEIAAAHAKNEAQLAKSIAVPTVSLDDDAQMRLQHFGDYCRSLGIRSLPAAPASVAAYAKGQYTRGTAPDAILHTLQDIEAVHSNANLANPIATTAVRAVLTEILKLDPPRSWSKSERLAFASLAPELQFIVERHARLDSNAVRKAQNEAAALKHQLEALQPKDIDNGTSYQETT